MGSICSKKHSKNSFQGKYIRFLWLPR